MIKLVEINPRNGYVFLFDYDEENRRTLIEGAKHILEEITSKKPKSRRELIQKLKIAYPKAKKYDWPVQEHNRQGYVFYQVY